MSLLNNYFILAFFYLSLGVHHLYEKLVFLKIFYLNHKLFPVIVNGEPKNPQHQMKSMDGKFNKQKWKYTYVPQSWVSKIKSQIKLQNITFTKDKIYFKHFKPQRQQTDEHIN